MNAFLSRAFARRPSEEWERDEHAEDWRLEWGRRERIWIVDWARRLEAVFLHTQADRLYDARDDKKMSDKDYVSSLYKKETRSLTPALDTYNAFHKPRFDYIVRKCQSLRPSPARVLDVGRSELTLRLLEHFPDVSTLGFRLGPKAVSGRSFPDGTTRAIRQHIVYDLNSAQDVTPVPTDERFDLVVFAEILEHLHTAPELTLNAMKSVMSPGGHLVVQTPNAAAFHKRLVLLAGFNPYEEIRVNAHNPGHFREYTKRELVKYGRTLDMAVVEHAYVDYFGAPTGLAGKLVSLSYKAIATVIPPFARGQTLILRKPG